MIESSKVKSTKRNIKQTYNGPPEIPHIIGVEPDQKNNERFIFKTFLKPPLTNGSRDNALYI